MNASENNWVTAGINLDEDLHFSTTYLRMTINSNNGKVFKGYSSLVAYYENFNEEYYLLADECKVLAAQLIQKIKSDSKWFDNILSEIIIRSKRLYDCFNEEKCTQNYFHSLSNDELYDIYLKQYNLTISLYEYARIPEILDRGEKYFTNYLLNYLVNLVGKDLSHIAFSKLIKTSQVSVYKQSQLELQDMVNIISAEQYNEHTKRYFRLYLPPRVKEMICAYVKKWKFLEYHGYGDRNLLTEDDVTSRLASLAEKNLALVNEKYDNEQEKEINLPEIPIDMLNLFRIYPQISIVKLYRKYIQNRNFYFLDLIISELSLRWRVEEAIVRSMLPEEIMQAISSEKEEFSIIRKRIPRCIFELNEKEEKIIIDPIEIEEKLRVVKAKCQEIRLNNELIGYPVSPGCVRGRTVKVCRKEDAEKHSPGDIILSDSADPDIFYAITDAGALLTVQGGATSHAGLYCREMNIPSIVGLQGLLSIKDGTLVEVDAYIGKVTILENKEEEEEDIAIGNKALNLRKIRALGFFVPEFKTLLFQEIVDAYNNGTIMQRLNALNLEKEKNYIIRSSAMDEDDEKQSNVGKYTSVCEVNANNLLNCMKHFITENAVKKYKGGIIVQEMLPFEYCGVTVTSGFSLNEMIIEFCEGPKNHITEGTGEKGYIVFDKDRDEIKELSNPFQSISREKLYSHVKTFIKIESLWGSDVDIEWGLLKEKLYILQVRSIVKHPS